MPQAPLKQNYLDPQTLAAIAPLELRARLIVEGLMIGMHKSPYQGFSVEFAQHRQYAPGDDIRHLDWKVFGRTDKLYLKQYQKETNLDLMILVDVSGSMAYGSQSFSAASSATRSPSRGWSKFDHAASLAAAMAYLALQQQDRVGLMLFGEEVRGVTRPSNARGHWRALVEQLSGEPLDPQRAVTDGSYAGRKTDLGRMFDQLNAKLVQRSLIIVVSDLFDDPASIERGLARLSHRRHDVILFQVLDHAELAFEFRSPSEFVGLEAEGRIQLDPAALRGAYLEALNAHSRAIEAASRRFRFDHLLLDSSVSIGAPLSRFLARRAAMSGKGS